MSNASKRGEGIAEEIGGKLRGAIGRMLGNQQMQAEGKARELEGKAKQESAKAAERTKGKVEEIVGAVKNRVGAVIDDDEMQAEGKAKADHPGESQLRLAWGRRSHSRRCGIDLRG